MQKTRSENIRRKHDGAIARWLDERGAALLLVITVTTLLMAVVTEFAYSTRIDLSLARNYQDEAKAFYIAKAGIDAAGVVLLYDFEQDDEKIDYEWTDLAMESMPDELWSLAYTMPMEIGDGMVVLNIQDELGKVNLNQFVNRSGVRCADEEIERLAAWVEHFEIDPDVADRIAYSIVDWIDLDDSPGDLGGAESDNYRGLTIEGVNEIFTAYEARNAPFCSVDELKLVDGVTDEIYNRLAPFVTVFPERTSNGKYPINVNTAKEDVLYFFDPEIDDQTVGAILDARTEQPFKNINEFKKILIDNGINTNRAAAIASEIAVRSDYFSVQSEAIVGDVTKIVSAVLRRIGKKHDIETIFWQVY